MNTTRRINFGFDRFSGFYMWAAFIVVFATWTPDTFLTSGTMHSVASQQAINAIVAIGVLIPLACGAFDLSIGATTNLAALLVTVLQVDHGWSMGTAILFTILVSAFIGFFNGFVVVKLHVDSFIATLGSASIILAFQAITTHGLQPLPVTTSSWASFTQDTLFGFQYVVFYMLAIALLAWWLLAKTPAGRFIYAVGGNHEAARLAGVRTGFWTWLSLTLSATLCGVAGVLYASQTGPSLTFGQTLLLPAFAAVFLGSTQFTPGRVNVWGTLVALFALATGIKGLQLVTGVQWLGDMFNGGALLVAVSFAVWRQTTRATAKRTAQRTSDSSPAATVEDRVAAESASSST